MRDVQWTVGWWNALTTSGRQSLIFWLAVLAACSQREAIAPPYQVPRVLDAYVTGEAAKLLDADGRLLLPSPVPGQYPEISAGRAAELTQAFLTTFGQLLKGRWEEWRGQKILIEKLKVCGRITYSRSSYEPASPIRTLWGRKQIGSWWLVTLCDGKSPEVVVAVSLHNTDLSIDARGWVVQPEPSGLNFLSIGIPRGAVLPIPPEAAVSMAAIESRARVASVPEFVMLPKPAAPWLGAWQMTMEKPLRLVGLTSGLRATTARLSVGYDELWPVRLLGEVALVPPRDGDDLNDAGYPYPTPAAPYRALFRTGIALAYERARVEGR